MLRGRHGLPPVAWRAYGKRNSLPREPHMPHFEATQTLPRPLAEVFEFFRSAANLVRITPPELHMELVEGPPLIESGSRVVLKGRRWGVPQRVVSKIVVFEPGVRFVDEQVEGPFRVWKHTHAFEAADGGTKIVDRIDFEPPGGLLGLMVTEGFIQRDLKWIFEFREQKLKELLG